jgi:DNA replication protein DnaC
VLEWTGDFLDVPARYCACAGGQRRLHQAENDRQEWMTWRRNSLYRHLDLPGEPDGAGLQLKDYTVDTYRAHLEALGQPAHPEHLNRALAFLEQWDRRRWLLLWGKNGNGKTGLLICLVKLLLARALAEGWDVGGTAPYQPQSWHARFIRSLDFIHRLQDGFAAEQAEERTGTVRAELEQAPLLAFDDFGKGHFTPWVMQEYSSLFDYRAMAGLPTFLTTNLSIRHMREQYGDYLIGRMLSHCQVIHVEGADTRFISALLENPDLSPEDLGMGLEDEEGEAARLAGG